MCVNCESAVENRQGSMNGLKGLGVYSEGLGVYSGLVLQQL